MKGKFIYYNIENNKNIPFFKEGDILKISYLFLSYNKRKFYYKDILGICLKKNIYNKQIYIKICYFLKYQKFYYYFNLKSPIIYNILKLNN